MRQIKLLALVLAITLSSSAYAQKIGHVDLQSILLEMPDYKNGLDSLTKASERAEKELQKLQARYQKALQIYQDSSKQWSESKRYTKMIELQGQEQGIQAYGQIERLNLDSAQQTLLIKILDKVKAASSEVAKEKGYAYVLTYSQESILYYEEKNDLTAAVRKKLGLL
ncbi:MAG: OmpH family outer membrane protein [Bacteroidia bacterium]